MEPFSDNSKKNLKLEYNIPFKEAVKTFAIKVGDGRIDGY